MKGRAVNVAGRPASIGGGPSNPNFLERDLNEAVMFPRPSRRCSRPKSR
jgi:hypothetical protein